ncbi:MAG TPA: 6,7-dimethyl-8-ribityllumazine synthase [Jatrophihabitantaceae bacterium]
MSGTGAPSTEPVAGADRLSVTVLASRWHGEIMDGLLDGARRALRANDVQDVTEIRVPGAFELPVAAAQIAQAGADVVVALGVVIRGDTPHFDYVCQGTTLGLTLVSVRTGVPVGFGLLTCDNEDQARNRAGLPGSAEDKGFETTVAALQTAITLQGLRRD